MKQSYSCRHLCTVLILMASSVFFSCKKALEQYNPGGLTAESVFLDPQGFETLVNGAYSYQRWWYGKTEGMMLSEMGTDIWNQGNAADDPGLTNYINLESIDEYITETWERLYSGINLCNYGITNIDQAGLAENLKNIREGELRFLRAFYYWHVVETWGASPMPVTPTDRIITDVHKSPVDSIYKQIFEDLDFARNNVPLTTKDFGRVTKPAVEAFLARMYLTRGLNQQAFDMADHVIKDYQFSLLSDYAALWPMSNMANAISKEVIYSVNYTKNLSLNDLENKLSFPYGHGRAGNNTHMIFIIVYDKLPGMMRTPEYGRPFNRIMVTRSLLNLYNDEIDARYDGTFLSVWKCNNTSTAPAGMKIGDTAVYCTNKIVSPEFRSGKLYKIYDLNDVYNPDGTVKDYRVSVQLKKFMDETRPSTNEQQSSRDFFVIRLPEMYLIAAEAQFKLGNASKAAEYINVIRERAAKPGHKEDMRISDSDLSIDFLMDEWAREFAGEQMRWFVLKRNNKLEERVKLYNPDAAPYIQPYHIVRPIPQKQLDAVTNMKDFVQNPGYH